MPISSQLASRLVKLQNPSVGSDELLLYRFYYQMYLLRKVEELLQNLRVKGLLWSSLEISVGQETSDIGVINALDSSRDTIFSNQRAHGQFVIYTDDIAGLLIELTGVTVRDGAGTAGSEHLRKFNVYTNGNHAGIVTNAVGAALASKLRGTGAITAAFLNAAKAGQAAIRESFDIASLWSLPILFVVEDAGCSDEPSGRFEFTSPVIQADDVFKVYAFACAAVAYVRSNQRPFVLSLVGQTPGLFRPENGCGAPSEWSLTGEREDPLWKMGQQLPPSARQPIEAFVEERVQKAVKMAANAQRQSQEQWMTN